MNGYRIVQLSIAVALAGFTIFHTLNANDSWIYTWLTGTSSILLFLNKPECPYWRLASAVVIVLGFIETIFLAWTFHKVESGPLVAHSNSLPEGKSILLTALSVAATTSTRLRKPNHTGITSYIRTLILLIALIGLVPVFGYSACFYSQNLPICHLYH